MMRDLVHSSYDDLRPDLERYSPDEYYKYIFQFEIETFHRRIEMAGCTRAGTVLDAGCGYGQWAAALGATNRRVIAYDRDPGMVKITEIFALREGLDNIGVQQGDLNQPLPYPGEMFDLVWCWGVLMFVRRDHLMREFNRVLKPGGKLLLGCVNSIGRWLHKLIVAGNPLNFDKIAWDLSVAALGRGHRPAAVPSYLTTKAAGTFCNLFGFGLLAAATDGHIDVTGGRRRLPMFPPRFLGLENNIEVLARKVATPPASQRTA